jgi:hypothetical protein
MVFLVAKVLTFIRVLGSLQIQASPWAAIPGLILWSWSDSLFGTFGGIAAFLVLVSSLVRFGRLQRQGRNRKTVNCPDARKHSDCQHKSAGPYTYNANGLPRS